MSLSFFPPYRDKSLTPQQLGRLVKRGAQLVWPSELSQGSSGDDRVRVVVKGKVRGYVEQRHASEAVERHGLTLHENAPKRTIRRCR